MYLECELIKYLHAVEHRTKLSEPISIDSRCRMHILLRCHDQLVVHHIVRREPHAKQRTCRMQICWHSISGIDILSNASQSRSLMKECRTDTLPDAKMITGYSKMLSLKVRSMRFDCNYYLNICFL